MLSRIALVLSFAATAAFGQYIAFDSAAASSSYGGFDAGSATSAGSGYWCSAGAHGASASVTWTGTTNAAYNVLGVNINWAYAPGEFKILTSADGGNFEEAACWSASSRSDVSFEEAVMFDSAKTAKAVTIVMRGPKSWNYFGLNEVSLIVESGYSFMLVSSETASEGEQCVTSTGLKSCLSAIAAGTGEEVFSLNDDGNLLTSAGTPLMSETFTIGSDGKLKTAGNHCLTASATAVSLTDCSLAPSFSMSVVTEYNPSAATNIRETATLLKAAAKRQGDLLAKLEGAIPTLDSCKFSVKMPNHTLSRLSKAQHQRSASSATSADPAMAAIAGIYSAFGVDMGAIGSLMGASAGALTSAAGKLIAA